MGRTHSTRRATRAALRAATLASFAVAAMGVQAEGLMLRAQETSNLQHSPAEYALTNAHPQVSSSIRLFGDYYFFDPTEGSRGPALGSLFGGFRASTGIVGLSQPLSLYETRPDALQSLPYIGLGYSHLWFNSQLRVNADFGLTSPNHGRGLLSSASSLDDVTSQLRWAPVMAVNVHYAF
jgi:hypothetical protein